MAKIRSAGEVFEGYNKPKRTPGESKKFAVLVKHGGENRIVRFGDPSMEHYKRISSPAAVRLRVEAAAGQTPCARMDFAHERGLPAAPGRRPRMQ